MASPRIASVARRATEAVRSLPDRALQETPLPYTALHAHDQAQLIREMHRYRRANPVVARVLWSVGGLFGAHRYYLEQFGFGALMTLSAGGVLVWWIVDGFKLRALVDAYNTEQAAREREDRPPIGMDFVPRVGPEVLLDMPPWYTARTEARRRPESRLRRWGSIGLDVVALMLFGYMLGGATAEVGQRMPAVAAIAMIFTIHFAHRLIPYREWPIARGLLHWDYKLRLFYHFNAPGRRLVLYFRPILALFYAPFRPKERAEARLYLEIGGVFVMASALIGLFRGEVFHQIVNLDIGSFLENWLKSVVIGFVLICGFTAPIGAILMKHTLLRRPNVVRWLMSAAVLVFLAQGFLKGW
ncbi:MAG: TM2 domain-containing protein [Rhodothermales bacterium]